MVRGPPKGGSAKSSRRANELLGESTQYFSLYLFPIYILFFSYFIYRPNEILSSVFVQFSRKEKKLFMDPYVINSKD